MSRLCQCNSGMVFPLYVTSVQRNIEPVYFRYGISSVCHVCASVIQVWYFLYMHVCGEKDRASVIHLWYFLCMSRMCQCNSGMVFPLYVTSVQRKIEPV